MRGKKLFRTAACGALVLACVVYHIASLFA